MAILLSSLVNYFGLVNGYLAYGVGFVVFFCVLILVLRHLSRSIVAEEARAGT
jgi:uncharacterized membrane protein